MPSPVPRGMSYRPMFKCQGEWCGNEQRFASEEEARLSAADRFSRWTVPSDYRVEESEDPVNYRYDTDRGDVMLTP